MPDNAQVKVEDFAATAEPNVVKNVDTPAGVLSETDMGWTGAGPWKYRLLKEPFLSREFEGQTIAKTYLLGADQEYQHSAEHEAYSVTIQPCPDPDQRSQDRYAVENWEMPGGHWSFSGVFDGHGGHDAADYTVSTLPSSIKSSLSSLLEASPNPSPEEISAILSDCISSFDASITSALLALFPGGEESIKSMNDSEIKVIINDKDRGGTNATLLARCMTGTTALVSLVDPSRENLWVASLGDCVAVLGATRISQNWVYGKLVSATHGGRTRSEVDRIRSEHPGENEVVLRSRVLGAIAVTRAIGDHLFKLPSLYTTRIFKNAASPFRISTPLEEILPRIKTPPYLTGTPEVKHISLKDTFSSTPAAHSKSSGRTVGSDATQDQRRFIILCSDGLVDLMDGDVDAELWAHVVGEALSSPVAPAPGFATRNAASALLRYAFGGDDAFLVSRLLTVEMCERWMDDTTIVVVPL